MGQIDLMKVFLNCMNLTCIPMFATVVTSVIHAGVLVLFLKTFNLGILGIIYANTLTNSI
jgi:hypothetical protein